MKRIIGIILTAMFVFGLAATAFAAVDIGGDARVRGVWRKNYNFDDDVDNDARYWDTRVRLTATADAGGGVKVVSRFALVDGKFDGTSNTRGTVSVDYAYLVVPVSGFTITAGLQVAGWGNKLLSHDDRKDRIKITTTSGDTTFGLFTDKADEQLNGDNDGDTDAYGALVITGGGDMKGGILIIFVTNDTSGDDGMVGSIFVNGAVGGLGLAAEAIYKGGDLYDGADGDAGMAAMIQLSKAMDAITISGAFAYATNGINADNDFNPTLFLGTAQPTAGMDFGAGDDDTAYAAALTVSFKASDSIGAYARAAYASISDNADSSAIEFDGGISVALAKNATWYLDAGIIMPDDLSVADDSALAFHQKLQINF